MGKVKLHPIFKECCGRLDKYATAKPFSDAKYHYATNGKIVCRQPIATDECMTNKGKNYPPVEKLPFDRERYTKRGITCPMPTSDYCEVAKGKPTLACNYLILLHHHGAVLFPPKMKKNGLWPPWRFEIPGTAIDGLLMPAFAPQGT